MIYKESDVSFYIIKNNQYMFFSSPIKSLASTVLHHHRHFTWFTTDVRLPLIIKGTENVSQLVLSLSVIKWMPLNDDMEDCHYSGCILHPTHLGIVLILIS